MPFIRMLAAKHFVLALFSFFAVFAVEPVEAQELRADIPVGRGQYVDVYVPDASKPRGLFQIRKRAPVIVYVHGGGWIRGDRKRVYNLPAYANERGYMLVSVSYRPVPRTNIDGQVADVTRAINWTRSNIARYGGDPRRIVIMGHSAGAHLVSMVGVKKTAGPLRGVVANDVQAYDMVAYASIRGGIDGVYAAAFGQNPSDWVKWSPTTYLRSARGLPPFMVMYSNSHRPRRAIVSVAFARELKKRGSRVTVFNGSRYSHGAIASRIGTSPGVTQALDRFLRTAFR